MLDLINDAVQNESQEFKKMKTSFGDERLFSRTEMEREQKTEKKKANRLLDSFNSIQRLAQVSNFLAQDNKQKSKEVEVPSQIEKRSTSNSLQMTNSQIEEYLQDNRSVRTAMHYQRSKDKENRGCYSHKGPGPKRPKFDSQPKNKSSKRKIANFEHEDSGAHLRMMIDRLNDQAFSKKRKRKSGAKGLSSRSKDYGNLPVNSIKESYNKKKKKPVYCKEAYNMQSLTSNLDTLQDHLNELRSGIQTTGFSPKNKNGHKKIITEEVNQNNSRMANQRNEYFENLTGMTTPIASSYYEEKSIRSSISSQMPDLPSTLKANEGMKTVEDDSVEEKLTRARKRMRQYKKKLGLMKVFLDKYEDKAIQKQSLEIYKAVKVLIEEEQKHGYNLKGEEVEVLKRMMTFKDEFEDEWGSL